MTAISTAVSGMLAAVARLNAAAENTANARSDGALPGAASAGAPAVYRPVDVVEISHAGGGVATAVRARTPAYQAAYEPYAPYADARGMVATPAVDEVHESVDRIEAMNRFKANLATVRTADDLLKAVLDLKR
jgi:flagellar basal-body rod protein FlgC